MDFEESVDKLSRKYNAPRGRVYDLMAGIEVAVGIVRPLEALSDKEKFNRKVYFIANQQLREKYLQPQKYASEKVLTKAEALQQ